MAYRSEKQKIRDQKSEGESRLAYIGTLAAGLAHEIRSPLNAICLNLALLREDLAVVIPERREEFGARLALISAEAEALEKFLAEFLAFARPPKLEMLPTDLNNLLRQMAEFIAPECARAKIEIIENFQQDLFPVPLDQHLFGRSVLLNLMRNALEAVGEQGTITISTMEDADKVEIRIADNGGGVPAELEGRVFEAFFSTKDHGTGLGLAIARRIVQEHGGELCLENRPDLGATFVIRLPKSKILEYRDEATAPAPKSKKHDRD